MAEDDAGQAAVREQFVTGAVRAKLAQNERYDLVAPEGVRRVALTAGDGAEKYTPHNWEQGIPASNLMNRAVRHCFRYLAGEGGGEDDLAHAAWNLLALMHFERHRPDLIDIPARWFACGGCGSKMLIEQEAGHRSICGGAT